MLVRTAALFLLFCSAPGFAAEAWIPIAGHVAGANSTFYVTDMRIVNLSSRSAAVSTGMAWAP